MKLEELKYIKQQKNLIYKNMKHLKTFKIYETGEWNRNIDWNYVKDNPDDNSEEASFINFLDERLKYVISMLDNDNILEIIDIGGHDLYQGAYAKVKIFGKTYKIWSMESSGLEDELYIEGFPINNLDENSNPGYVGDTENIAELLNSINEVGGIEIYKTTNKFNL